MIKFVLKTLFVCLPAFFFYSAKAQVIGTFAGSGILSAYSGDGGASFFAIIGYTWHVAADTSGNVYFSDYSHDLIHKVSPAYIITTLTEPANGPAGIAIDKAGNIYYCDAHLYRIRKINTAGVVTSIAGTGVAGFSGDGGPAIAATVNRPNGICVSASGKIYFADVLNNRIRAIDTAGIITTVAGTGTMGFSGDGGPATLAQFTTPNDVALDTSGNLYIVDEGNQRVRKINTSGIITTFAGTGAAGFSGDGGPATAAQLYTPWGITIDRYGVVYISDHDNNRIRKIDVSGIITTIAGTGTAGYSGDGGPATAAKLNGPTGMAFDRPGNMYICDWQNFRIRKIKTTNMSPVFTDSVKLPIKLCAGDTLILDTFLHVADTNAGQAITWNIVSGPHHGIASAYYSLTDTGGVHTPSGAIYVADSGYKGYDTVKIRVTDGMSDDTAIRIFQIGPTIGPIILPAGQSANYFCRGETMQLSCIDTGGIWIAKNANATITDSGKLSGISYGPDTIMYIITTPCGPDTSTLKIWVHICGAVANGSGLSESLNIYPNPNSGAFTFYLSQPLSEMVQISMVDAMGRKVGQYNAYSNDTFEIKDIPKGVYILRYTTSHSVGSEIVVVGD